MPAVARISRAVVPGFPHHITQRGNRRQQTFFSDDDYEAYIDLMHQWCTHYNVDIWGYCLMPNHVHLIAVPEHEQSLALAIGEAHRRYTRLVNFREGWRGHLWQGRFASYVMGEPYLLTCIRYVETNPVRAALVATPTQWRWSSAHAHASHQSDRLVNVNPLLNLVDSSWDDFLRAETSLEEGDTLRRHERTGRPLGDPAFVDIMEKELGRLLRPSKVGRKPRKATRGRRIQS